MRIDVYENYYNSISKSLEMFLMQYNQILELINESLLNLQKKLDVVLNL